MSALDSTGAMAAVRCVIELEYPSEDVARRVHRSVSLDNEGYLVSEVRGSFISAIVEADSLSSLLHTLDDFLSCVGVAEGVVKTRS